MAARSKKQQLLFWLASHFGWVLVLLWGRLTRTEIVGGNHLAALRAQGQPFLLCIWHGRIFLPMYLHRKDGLYAMVSQHRDGEMIARTLHKLGYQTVRGSSSHGGRQAFHAMVQALNRGASGAIMPDGPRGPRHYFKPGALRIAQRTGAYLLPFSFSADRAIRFKSWDRFMLWRPFSRTIAMYGRPIAVPQRLDKEQFETLRAFIEEHMIRMEEQTDSYFHHDRLDWDSRSPAARRS